jgi:hypothetical protein
LAKDRIITKRMSFISGDFDGSGGNALWFSGSDAAKKGCFFGKGFPRRRWPANMEVGTGRLAELVAIIMARKLGLLFIWRVQKKLVPKERVIGIYKSSFFGSGGPAYFHFLPCIFDILISSI